ncbi:hypothetical protein [Cytobacillus pseudoceanisediminis]
MGIEIKNTSIDKKWQVLYNGIVKYNREISPKYNKIEKGKLIER